MLTMPRALTDLIQTSSYLHSKHTETLQSRLLLKLLQWKLMSYLSCLFSYSMRALCMFVCTRIFSHAYSMPCLRSSKVKCFTKTEDVVVVKGWCIIMYLFIYFFSVKIGVLFVFLCIKITFSIQLIEMPVENHSHSPYYALPLWKGMESGRAISLSQRTFWRSNNQ